MYAVFATGGKQYRAAPGDKIKVEKLNADEGAQIELDQVLMIADGDQITVGAPLVDGVTVTARVLTQGRGEKIRVVKFHRRKQYRKEQGHRQSFTELEIIGVGKGGTAKPKKAEKAEKAPVEAKEPAKKKATAKKAAAKAPVKKAAAKKATAKKASAKKATAKKTTAKKATARKAGNAEDK